jgi:hypothetical protein
MGGTPTLNDSLPPKRRQFSLEDVEDHYLEWLEKWIAEIEAPPDTRCVAARETWCPLRSMIASYASNRDSSAVSLEPVRVSLTFARSAYPGRG